MKKILSLVIILLLGQAVKAQQVNVTGFTVKPALPPDIKTMSPPILKQPANGQTINTGRQLLFSWQAPMPTPTSTITYKIKIVEIKGDQSPQAAFGTNKPIFEKDSPFVRTNKPIFERDSSLWVNIQYSSTAIPFVSGKQYVWNVQALNREGKPIGTNKGTSEFFTFKALF